MSSIWQKLPKPFIALAPMDDVTDVVFRRTVASVARPDIFFTEFVSVDALAHSRGRVTALTKLKFDKKERPIIAQIWGVEVNHYEIAARMIAEMGFDGIDINMGCPQKKEVKMGAGAALITNPDKAAEIIAAVKRGAGRLPVSVKTRLGYHAIDTENWIAHILRQDIAALTVHTRTAKEMSEPPAHHTEFKKVVALRDKIAPRTIIIGNGDIISRVHGERIAIKFGLDGTMIGRGIFSNTHCFSKKSEIALPADDLCLYINHIDLWLKTWKGVKNPENLKKFAKMYVHDFDGASTLRQKLMRLKTLEQIKTTLEEYIRQHKP